MKLEVGMYVRTPKGIAKVTSMLDETHQYIVYTDNENIVFEYYLTKDYLNNKSKWVSDYASKYSFNIIDLIEVGDYVNGYKLLYQDSHYSYFDTDTCDWIYIKKDEQIKSIVTKEMFANAEYKVETD